MAERRTPVASFLVEMECDYCHKGDMKPCGLVLTVNPPLYQHKCEHCGAAANFQEKYPKVVYQILDRPPVPWAS